MTRDHIRDYATAAFRLYAAQGRPSAEALREKIFGETLRKARQRETLGIKGRIGKPTEQALLAAEGALEKRAAELNDLLAVENTLFILEKQGRRHDIISAVEAVYFADAHKDLGRGDISARVRRASLFIPAGEATVYRHLRYARRLFAIERGLRL